jgi:hypothetical protein
MIFLVLMLAAQLAAQDRTTTISVKSSELNNGVVIVNAIQPAMEDQTKASFELHCNKNMPACKAPEAGTYQMVRLPKNWGMYDCVNVDLYAASANPATGEKVGEYCLIEK